MKLTEEEVLKIIIKQKGQCKADIFAGPSKNWESIRCTECPFFYGAPCGISKKSPYESKLKEAKKKLKEIQKIKYIEGLK
jgi:hypothetical protein